MKITKMTVQILICFVFAFDFMIAFSQNDSVLYFNSDWEKTDSLNAAYFRIISDINSKQKVYKITDYYISGEIQMEGAFSNLKKETKTGLFTWYYKNGNKSSYATYEKGKRIGSFERFYINGKLCQTGFYKDGKYFIDKAWDSTGNEVASDGTGIGYGLNNSGKVEQKYEILNGRFNGKFIGYYENGDIYFEDEYINGEFMKGVSFDSLRIKHPYHKIMQNAEFQGGDIKQFELYIRNNLDYPTSLIDRGISDKVVCKFIVNNAGYITDFEFIEESSFKKFNQEVALTVLSSPAWKPAYYRGIPTKQRFILPINFVLE